MARNHVPTICTMAAMTVSWFAAGPPDAAAEVTFHLHRHGTETDTGHPDFLAALIDGYVEDFEHPDMIPNETEVPMLTFGGNELHFAGEWDGPFMPYIGYSTAFNVQGRVYRNVLVSGYQLTITPGTNTHLRALGMWIFDDRRALDSAYLIEVVETDGTVWTAVLENQIPRNSNGHEIEGFAGAVSDVGIASMRIVAVNPSTLAPHSDFFEVDHLLADFTRPPVQEAPPEEAPPGFGPPWGPPEFVTLPPQAQAALEKARQQVAENQNASTTNEPNRQQGLEKAAANVANKGKK